MAPFLGPSYGVYTMIGANDYAYSLSRNTSIQVEK